MAKKQKLTSEQVILVKNLYIKCLTWPAILAEYNRKYPHKPGTKRVAVENLRNAFRNRYDPSILEKRLPKKAIILGKTLQRIKKPAAEVWAAIEKIVGHPLDYHAVGRILRDSEEEVYISQGQIIVEPRKVNLNKGSFFISATIPSTEVETVRSDGTVVWKVNTNRPALRAMETWLGERGKPKRSPIFFPMRAHVGALVKQPHTYDAVIRKYRDVFATDVTLNNNLHLFDSQINPQQIQPLTGMNHIDYWAGSDVDPDPNKRMSLMIASPKQALLTVAQGKELHPRIMCSMGTMSVGSGLYRKERIGRIAEALHNDGAMIVDVDGDWFSTRPVQFSPKDGSFVDMKKRYHADGRITDERVRGITPGDIHLIEHSPLALDTTIDQINYFEPDDVFLQDLLTWITISHHVSKDSLARRMIRKQIGFLPDEVELAKSYMKMFRERTNKKTRLNVVSDSNHLGHLDKYLKEYRFIKDHANEDLAFDLYPAFSRGLNPTRMLIDSDKDLLACAIGGKYGKNDYNWLDKNKDVWIDRIQQNSHGHLGLQGARGSKNATYTSYGRANTGHTHNPFIFNGVYGAGTHHAIGHDEDVASPAFTDGQVRSWAHANIVQYTGGMRQLIFSVKGRWKL